MNFCSNQTFLYHKRGITVNFPLHILANLLVTIDFLPNLSDLKCQHLCLTYILILVDYVHSSGLKFSHEGKIRPHGGADKDVIKPITVDVTGGDSVAEVGANLISRQIVQICQV